MKLTYQLIAGLSIIAIFVIISGIIGILATDAINTRVETLTRITAPATQVVDNMIIAIAQMNALVQEFSREDTLSQLEELRSEFDSLNQQVLDFQADALKLIEDDNLLENLRTAEKKYNSFKEKATKAMTAHRNELATKDKSERERYREVQEALLKQTGDGTTDLIVALKEIATRVSTLNKKADEESVYAVRTTRIVLLITTILSISLAIVIAILLAHSIINPINELSQAAAKVSTGNFDVTVKEAKMNNELRQLTSTFNKMVASLKGMLEESPKWKQFMEIVPSPEKPVSKPEKYTIAPGASYLIKESQAKQAFNIFLEKVTHNSPGLCITRLNPALVQKQYGLQKTLLVWLSDVREAEIFSSSDLLIISKIILDFVAKAEKSVLLLDRLDYLIAKHGFSEVLKFIIKINDKIMVSNAILLIPIDPSLLKTEECSFLEKELSTLPTIGDTEALQPDLNKILTLIENRKKLGRTVTFKDITHELAITSPTTQRRITDLYNRDLITIVKQGRNKILQLTAEGEQMVRRRF